MLPFMAGAQAAGQIAGAAGGGPATSTSGPATSTGPTINISGPGMKTNTVALIVLGIVVLVAVMLKKGK